MTAGTTLAGDWVGRRVVLRRSPGGSHDAHSVDALGDLLSLDERTAVVETRTGRVDVPRAEITAARLVAPAPREQYRLEAVAERGWRAREVVPTDDGWLLRADAGWTGRANSALPLRTLSRPLDDVLAELTAWYTARNLPAIIQVPLPAAGALDNALAARGWTFPEDNRVLVARLDLVAAALSTRSAPFVASVTDHADPAWLDAYQYRGRPLPDNALALLARHPDVAFVSVRDERGDVIANARAVVDEDHLGLTALGVHRDRRREGLAHVVLAAAVAWARSRGARRCYLQVSNSNAPALALYAGLGFFVHHSYRYRTAPSIDS